MSVFKEITVLTGQSLSDVAIQEYGCLESRVMLFQDNTTVLSSFSTVPQPGTILKVRTEVPSLTDNNRAVADSLLKAERKVVSNRIVATGLVKGYVTVGYWQYKLTNDYKIQIIP